jgi:U3 small nucleolar RNA-associated protein 20
MYCGNSVLESEHQAATFALIKAIVAQSVMLPAVYDLMDDLCSLAVTSHRAPLRATCAQIFLQYLVSYPLGEKRLEQHLRQVLEGTAYRHEVQLLLQTPLQKLLLWRV